MTFTTWLVYFVAAIGLSLTPGPNSLLVLTHGALYGHRRTVFTMLGGLLGFTALIALSMLGIGALLQTSVTALILLKWLGGAYLIWLGWQLWRAPAINLSPTFTAHTHVCSRLLFRQGLLAALSNPKALLFYGAFLPQFIDANQPLMTQFIVMVLTFVLVEMLVEYALARLAHQIRPWLEKMGKRFNRICGGAFAVMGVALPLSGR